MELTKKLSLIEEILDVEEGSLTAETPLDSVEEWDSIARLSLIAMLDDEFGKSISSKELKALRTVADILAYME